MQPPCQHLEADDLAAGEVDDRLEVGNDLPALQPAPQLRRGAQTVDEHATGVGGEGGDAIAPAGLGPVHRRVGVAEQVGRS